jgi:hypothetical protein
MSSPLSSQTRAVAAPLSRSHGRQQFDIVRSSSTHCHQACSDRGIPFQVFPDKPPEDLHRAQHAPETRAHILNHCSWYIRRVDHFKGGIDTIPGLILFLADNPTAFSFNPTEQPRILNRDWQSYRTEIYWQHDETNEIRKKKKLPLEEGPIFYHEMVEYSMSKTLSLKRRRRSGRGEGFHFLIFLCYQFHFSMFR